MQEILKNRNYDRMRFSLQEEQEGREEIPY